jgi:hypothetical protein
MTLLTPAARGRLEGLACRERFELCGTCAGNPRTPCEPCAGERQCVADLADRGTTDSCIAVTLNLPVWRVAQLLDDRSTIARTPAMVDPWWLLRPELGDRLIDRLAADPPAGEASSWPVLEWAMWTKLQLEAKGWTQRSVDNVLAGSHIPNRVLREKVASAKARALAENGTPMSSTQLALMCGIGKGDGTYLDRVLGTRPEPAMTKGGRTYPGRTRTAIRKATAALVVEAAGIAMTEIPGL